MSRFEKVVELSDEQFLRAVGVDKATFNLVLERVTTYFEKLKEERPMKKRGKKSSLTLADRLLLTFTYLRHYPTFARLGEEFGISESYANKIYHQMLDALVKTLSVKNRKHLMEGDLEAIVIDATEQPIERPKKGQRAYYSGKKRHTIKVQLIVCLAMLEILSVICRKGRVHDFRVLEESRIAISPATEKLADSGYQGIDGLYSNSSTPTKAYKNKPLTEEAKKSNRQLATRRVGVENVVRRCKVFRITKDVYRGKHRNYGKTWNVIAAIVNLRYCSTSCETV